MQSHYFDAIQALLVASLQKTAGYVTWPELTVLVMVLRIDEDWYWAWDGMEWQPRIRLGHAINVDFDRWGGIFKESYESYEMCVSTGILPFKNFTLQSKRIKDWKTMRDPSPTHRFSLFAPPGSVGLAIPKLLYQVLPSTINELLKVSAKEEPCADPWNSVRSASVRAVRSVSIVHLRSS